MDDPAGKGPTMTMRRRLRCLWLCTTIVAGLAPAACDAQQEAEGRAEVQALIDELLPQIRRVSGLEAREPVRFERPSRSQIRSYVERQLQDELPPEELEATRAVYAALGLVSDTLDLRGLLLDLYTEQIMGYYDPGTETLYVVQGVEPDSIIPVLSHELVHALQDQYVDLDSLMARERGNDRQTAAQAAMEGQATVVMIALTAMRMTGEPLDIGTMPDLGAQWGPVLEAGYDQYPVFRSAPRILRETLLFPYLRGASFVQALARARTSGEGGEDYVPPPFPWDSLLPQSTEQVLHPDAKFLARRDAPTELELGAVPEPWRARYRNTFGELELGIFLSEYLGERGRDLVRGWDGDRYVLMEDAEGHRILAWYSVWDDDVAANRFAGAYREALERRPDRRATVERLELEGRAAVRIVDVPASMEPDAALAPPAALRAPR